MKRKVEADAPPQLTREEELHDVYTELNKEGVRRRDIVAQIEAAHRELVEEIETRLAKDERDVAALTRARSLRSNIADLQHSVNGIDARVQRLTARVSELEPIRAREIAEEADRALVAEIERTAEQAVAADALMFEAAGRMLAAMAELQKCRERLLSPQLLVRANRIGVTARLTSAHNGRMWQFWREHGGDKFRIPFELFGVDAV